MRLRFAIAAAAASAASLAAIPAPANGRFPAANQLVFSSADSKLVVLRTTFGILISRDYGASWVWLCEDALGLSASSQEDPPVALTAGGSMIVGTSSALETSPDLGCTWNVQGGALAHQTVVDVAVRPDSPHAVVALQSSYDAEAGAGNLGYQSQAFQSTDDGRTWTPLGVPIEAGVITTTIDVAATDPQRLYVSAYRLATEAGPASASLFVSTNQGASWTERPLPPLEPASESAAFIGAVDPTDADVVYLRTGQGGALAKPSRLFVTRDAGQSFQMALQLTGPMLGFALSADGSRAFAGGPADGLLAAPSGSVGTPGAFSVVTSSLHVQCLATRGTDLWACSDTQSGFLAGVSPTQNATFVPKLQLVDIQTPIACEADAAGGQCSGYPFVALCRMFSNCPLPDAGPTGEADSGGDGGRPDGATGTGGSSSGSGAGSSGAASSGSIGGSGSGGTWRATGGCSVTGGGAAAGFAIAVLGAAAVARRRKR
jgi:MYXO-CTERM domain-containing protein